MKLYRNAIILVVILGLLTGAYFLVKSKQNGSDSGTSSSTVKIFSVDESKINNITLVNKDGTFTFERKDKDWAITSPGNLKINTAKISSISSDMASLSANKVIEDDAKDLSVYGLDKPSTATAKLSDGTVLALEIGSKTPTGDNYYVKEKDKNKVYVISTYTAEELVPSLLGLLDKTLVSFKPENVKDMELEKAGKVVFSVKKTSDTDWTMTEPVDADANLDSITTILNTVVNVSVKDYIELNAADLSKYGLDAPSYSMSVGTADQKFGLVFGSEKVKGSEIYAKLADGKDVFTLDESSLNFLDKPLKEMMNVFAYLVNITDVNKVEVQMDGRKDVMEIQTDKDNDKDKDKFTFNGQDVAALKDDKGDQLARKYYQALIGVTMDDIDIGATPSGSAEITFTYYLNKDPGVVKVEFIPKDQNYYYVVKNGKYSNILVSRKKFYDTDSVRDVYTKLSNAMAEKKK